jgi:hypothetical protein
MRMQEGDQEEIEVGIKLQAIGSLNQLLELHLDSLLLFRKVPSLRGTQWLLGLKMMQGCLDSRS